MHCEDVTVLPREVTYTTAMDSKDKLLDIHTQQKFFTFQLPTKDDNETNVVAYTFSPKNASERLDLELKSSTSDNDLVFRLRATLHSSKMDSVDQGMRVTLTEVETGRVIVDGSAEDHDERSVHLDALEVSSSRTYRVKYEFWEKNLGVRSYEDKTISGGHLGSTACSKPFVVQELAVVSKDLLQQRARAYRDTKEGTGKETNGS